jgi:RNA polymerase sigma factor (sigma-70 family)
MGQSAVLPVIRKIADGHRDKHASDRELLTRFAEKRDEDAFAALVRRHGSMVMAVGLRVLRHHQDAEDVCQATFLLLAKKANTTAWRDSVANWLYEVAFHLSLKARDAATRRTAHEGKVQPKTPPDPLADISARDLQTILDEELSRVAKKYRTPLILCCLEGKTRDEAARFLGVPLSTVISRLVEGREELRRRLAKRGVPLSLALAGMTLLSETARAAVSATLVRATSQVALQVVAGETITNLVSTNVSALVKGGMQTMFVIKLKVAAAFGLMSAVACFAAWAVLANASAQESPPRSLVPVALGEKPAGEKKPRTGPGTLLLAREGGLIPLTPEGKEEGDQLTPPKDARSTFQGRLSPDGTRAAFVVNKGKPRGPGDDLDAAWPFQVVIRKLGAADPISVTDFAVKGRLTVSWAPDGKHVLVTNDARADGSLDHVLVDAATGKTEPIDLPANARVLDWSRDGKTFLVHYLKDKTFRLGLAAKADKELRELTELKVRLSWGVIGRLSPDGSKVLFTDADPEQKDAHKWHRSSQPHVLDVATKKRTPLAEFPDNAQALGLAWSPDGKRVAYTWVQLHPELLKKDSINIADDAVATEAFLMVADADGKNAKSVSSGKNNSVSNPIFGSIDWR